MGLEGVELMLAVEDEFGIRVPEERAQEMETVRDLYDYIVETLISARPGVCPSMFVFYRMRRALAESLGMDRRSITPDSDFRELLAESTRPRHWERMRDEVGLSIVDLALPAREARIARIAGTALLWAAVVIILAVASALAGWGGWPMFLAGLPVGACMALLVLHPVLTWHTRYERAHATLIPEGHETPRAVVSRIVPENEWLIRRESREWLQANIEDRLLHHVREICCYIPREVTLDSRFVDDLKFG
ncbi:MAG: hypothetical protein ACOX9R_10370 [Armatimonadota bacterium]|jgi:acyl carrier protein